MPALRGGQEWPRADRSRAGQSLDWPGRRRAGRRADAELGLQPQAGPHGRLKGINDIGFTLAPAAEIIAGYENLIAAAHAAGLKISGATLTPFQGAGYYSAAGEAEREAVNHWIRTSGAFNSVIDFDQAVRDPAAPLRLLPAYDSGDHLHPNDAGYQAMANAVNLAIF